MGPLQNYGEMKLRLDKTIQNQSKKHIEAKTLLLIKFCVS